MTSRPVASSSLVSCVSSTINLEAFSADDVISYTTQYFSEQEEAQKFLSSIKVLLLPVSALLVWKLFLLMISFVLSPQLRCWVIYPFVLSHFSICIESFFHLYWVICPFVLSHLSICTPFVLSHLSVCTESFVHLHWVICPQLRCWVICPLSSVKVLLLVYPPLSVWKLSLLMMSFPIPFSTFLNKKHKTFYPQCWYYSYVIFGWN